MSPILPNGWPPPVSEELLNRLKEHQKLLGTKVADAYKKAVMDKTKQ